MNEKHEEMRVDNENAGGFSVFSVHNATNPDGSAARSCLRTARSSIDTSQVNLHLRTHGREASGWWPTIGMYDIGAQVLREASW